MKQQQSPLRQVQVHMLWDTPKFPLPFHFPQIEQSAVQKSQVYHLINFMKCQAHQCLPMEVSTMKTPCHHLTRSARSVRAGELDPGLGHITSSRAAEAAAGTGIGIGIGIGTESGLMKPLMNPIPFSKNCTPLSAGAACRWSTCRITVRTVRTCQLERVALAKGAGSLVCGLRNALDGDDDDDDDGGGCARGKGTRTTATTTPTPKSVMMMGRWTEPLSPDSVIHSDGSMASLTHIPDCLSGTGRHPDPATRIRDASV
uniref:HDC01518 n=1 Tax=Drosophila melanogaster TaxID=7227 RepID=Q6IHR7_DROME|nr:TPA_inf: HDC01518 [Drosophila melanogaster]